MPEGESNIEARHQVVDVTKEFLEQTDSEFHGNWASKAELHLKIDLDLHDVVGNTAKLNSLKHFLLEGETRKLIVRATQEEADHFKTLLPSATEWQIITRE